MGVKFKLPTEEILVLVGSLLNAGSDPSEIGGLVGEFLDDVLAFDELVQGPVGEALEAIDGPVLVAAAKLVVALFPERAKTVAAAHAAGTLGSTA